MRNIVITVGIVGMLSLTACMTAAEKAEREAKLARVEAEVRERLEQEEEQQTKHALPAEQDAEFIKWQKENEAYILGLCASTPGAEHQYAWENYRIAVSTDKERASAAEQQGRRVTPCPEQRVAEVAAGRTPEDLQAFVDEFNRNIKEYKAKHADVLTTPEAREAISQYVQKAEAQIRAGNAKRDQWLGTPEGKAYVRNLCALSGAERQRELSVALKYHGLIAPDDPLHTPDAYARGFRVIECGEEKTSALGYIWSDWHPAGGLSLLEPFAGFIWSDPRRPT